MPARVGVVLAFEGEQMPDVTVRQVEGGYRVHLVADISAVSVEDCHRMFPVKLSELFRVYELVGQSDYLLNALTTFLGRTKEDS